MNDNKYYVYGLFDPAKEFPFYIGKGLEKRMYRHFQESTKGENPHKDRKVEKIKKEDREPYAKKLYTNLSEKKAYMKEWCLINIYFLKLTNIDKSFGTGLGSKKEHPLYGKELSKEHKQRISETHKGKTLSKETKERLSEVNGGKNNPMYGKNHSTEAKQEMSKSQKGKSHTEETKKKMSNSTKGENNPNYGKSLSEETKQKISESKRGENNSNSKLSEQEARKVKYLALNSDLKNKEIANRYSIKGTTVSCIKTERSWSHIEPQKTEF